MNNKLTTVVPYKCAKLSEYCAREREREMKLILWREAKSMSPIANEAEYEREKNLHLSHRNMVYPFIKLSSAIILDRIIIIQRIYWAKCVRSFFVFFVINELNLWYTDAIFIGRNENALNVERWIIIWRGYASNWMNSMLSKWWYIRYDIVATWSVY